MEKLGREHDGFYRTPSGFCAVVPRRASGVTPDNFNYFEFKSSALSQVTRVEWPKDEPLALFDNDVGVLMVRLGYALQPTAEVIADYNALVDAASTPTPEPVPPQQGATTQTSDTTPAPAPKRGKGASTATPAPVADKVADVTFPPEGWAPHPDAPGFFYKGQEVLSEADLRAKVDA